MSHERKSSLRYPTALSVAFLQFGGIEKQETCYFGQEGGGGGGVPSGCLNLRDINP